MSSDTRDYPNLAHINMFIWMCDLRKSEFENHLAWIFGLELLGTDYQPTDDSDQPVDDPAVNEYAKSLREI